MYMHGLTILEMSSHHYNRKRPYLPDCPYRVLILGPRAAFLSFLARRLASLAAASLLPSSGGGELIHPANFWNTQYAEMLT